MTSFTSVTSAEASSPNTAILGVQPSLLQDRFAKGRDKGSSRSLTGCTRLLEEGARFLGSRITFERTRVPHPPVAGKIPQSFLLPHMPLFSFMANPAGKKKKKSEMKAGKLPEQRAI